MQHVRHNTLAKLKKNQAVPFAISQLKDALQDGGLWQYSTVPALEAVYGADLFTDFEVFKAALKGLYEFHTAAMTAWTAMPITDAGNSTQGVVSAHAPTADVAQDKIDFGVFLYDLQTVGGVNGQIELTAQV